MKYYAKFGNKHMSRIGKLSIQVPDSVEVRIDGQEVTVKGPKGELKREFPRRAKISIDDKELKVEVKDKENDKAIWGLSRALLNNMVLGVTDGFTKELEINGVGYKADVQGTKLVLNVGYSHSVEMPIPEGIAVKVEKNLIALSGFNKEILGQFAANVRKVRPPEPYKGKGIKYLKEHVRRKVGKKAIAAEGGEG